MEGWREGGAEVGREREKNIYDMYRFKDRYYAMSLNMYKQNMSSC